jgi:hypothetical protein
MSVSLTARDVLKQPGLTSICGTSGVMKVLVTRSITWQQLLQRAHVFSSSSGGGR